MREEFSISRWFQTCDIPLVVAGPCSAESRQQVIDTALGLSAIPEVRVLRGGIWKPRTRPNGFEGVGEQGLLWLSEAKEITGLPVCVEIATPKHYELALKHGVDMVWVGARTVANPFSMQELAMAMRQSPIPVFVKNPIAPDLKLWIGAVERLMALDVCHLGAIHRGFQYPNSQPYRNAPMWNAVVEFRRFFPDMPLITDISHICGCRELLGSIAQKAIDMATDGLMIESHDHPDMALTDAQQQITPAELSQLLSSLSFKVKKSSVDENCLQELRSVIDNIDDEIVNLLAQRMEISRKIGVYKRKNNLTVLQMERWNHILSKYIADAELLGLDPAMVRKVFEAIHEGSIQTQSDS